MYYIRIFLFSTGLAPNRHDYTRFSFRFWLTYGSPHAPTIKCSLRHTLPRSNARYTTRSHNQILVTPHAPTIKCSLHHTLPRSNARYTTRSRDKMLATSHIPQSNARYNTCSRNQMLVTPHAPAIKCSLHHTLPRSNAR